MVAVYRRSLLITSIFFVKKEARPSAETEVGGRRCSMTEKRR